MDAERIQLEYERRLLIAPAQRWGWSFMYVPAARMTSAKVVLIGLNPGGSQLDPPNEWDYQNGENAYVDESWRGLEAGEHHLQVEVRSLFEALGVSASDVFAANLVPFRSPSWDRLPDRRGALAFGRELWRWVLSQSRARVFVSLGKRAGEEIAQLIGATLESSTAAGWGPQTIDTYRNNAGQVVLSLPHLSRFKIFGNGRTIARDHVAETARRVL